MNMNSKRRGTLNNTRQKQHEFNRTRTRGLGTKIVLCNICELPAIVNKFMKFLLIFPFSKEIFLLAGYDLVA